MKVDEITLSCAFRYALGSMTYVVSSVVDDILNNWDALSEGTKARFVKEIKDHREEYGKCGMEMDDSQWQKIVDKYNKSYKHINN